MRISDWSSDVCASDLQAGRPQLRGQPQAGDGGVAPGFCRRGFSRELLVRLQDQELAAEAAPAQSSRFIHEEGPAMPALLHPANRRSAGARIAATRIRTLPALRSEEHQSELLSLMRTSYAVFC